jgi:hypothetical protein
MLLQFKRHRILLSFFVLLIFCSFMVIRQFREKMARHIEIRESMILLHARGYKTEADKLFNRLLANVPKLSNKGLMDDFQRTQLLVDPLSTQPGNVIWKYHWVVSNELEQRSESTLVRARKLAEEP